MTQEDLLHLQEGDVIRLGPKTIQPGLLLTVRKCHTAPWKQGAYRADGTKPKQFYGLHHSGAFEVRA